MFPFGEAFAENLILSIYVFQNGTKILLLCVWAGYVTILISLFSPVHSEQAAVLCGQTV